MSKIELVVFDMAGTTVKDRKEVERCFLIAAESTGLNAETDRVISMMGLPKIQVFQELWQEQVGLDYPDYVQKIAASFGKFREILEEHYLTQPVEPTEGCLELFDWLRSQKIAIALSTGFYREVTDIILNRLGWDKGLNSDRVGSEGSVIQVSVTPSEIFREEGRPAPYMIQKAMYELGIRDSRKVIAIGDTPADLQAGINANCLFSFGVTNGTHTGEQLSNYPNDGLFGSLCEFKEKLASL